MNSIKRREFLKKGSACCLLLTGAGAFAFAGDEKPNPKELNYCGYKCPEDCKMFVAGKSEDEALKKEAFKAWRLEEKYGISYSPELVFCNRCKTDGKELYQMHVKMIDYEIELFFSYSRLKILS